MKPLTGLDRRSYSFQAAHVCNRMVSGSFHTPFGALCNFPSRYVVCYRSWVVFSLGGCFPPCSLATAKARYSAFCTTSVPTCLRGYHTLFPGFPAEFGYWSQGRICSGEPHISPDFHQGIRFGPSRFRSPLLTGSQLISFPAGTQMFPSPAFAILSDHRDALRQSR
jgi:hypothetical protein